MAQVAQSGCRAAGTEPTAQPLVTHTQPCTQGTPSPAGQVHVNPNGAARPWVAAQPRTEPWFRASGGVHISVLPLADRGSRGHGHISDLEFLHPHNEADGAGLKCAVSPRGWGWAQGDSCCTLNAAPQDNSSLVVTLKDVTCGERIKCPRPCWGNLSNRQSDKPLEIQKLSGS